MYLNDIPEEEIIKKLADQGVVDVYKFQKLEENIHKKTGVLLITFDLYNLPTKLKISWNLVNVREYFPNPMRCRTCQKLGHTKNHCKNPPTCPQCNLPPHSPNQCSRVQCANCLDEHPASSNKCTKFMQQKELLKIKIKNKCTIKEAWTILRNNTPITSPNTTYSAVASQNTNKNQEIIENNMEIESKNTTINNSSNIHNTRKSTYKSVISSLPSIQSNTTKKYNPTM